MFFAATVNMMQLVDLPYAMDNFKINISEKWLSKNFIDRYLKFFWNRIDILKESYPTVKKPLWLFLPYLGILPL